MRGSMRRGGEKPESRPFSSEKRDRIAVLMAVLTAGALVLTFILSGGTQFLMPGPLASAHGAIAKCSACHTASGAGKLSWLHGLVAGDPLADSRACLTCHKMPNTAFNAHSAAPQVLKISADRLRKVAAITPQPESAQLQNIAFPADKVMATGMPCATCHQEHRGAGFKLNEISNAQCQSCHVVKFDSFDGHHPKFDNYPFKRRTRIIYDHAGHFGKHFPEVAKKDPARKIPSTCATCHSSSADKRLMAVAPFTETCTACHLDQIVGNERVSGPKGIAFLTLPGLDLQTLKEKNASIGEWPDGSEAELTPFMKVMISRTERGRALIKVVSGLNLQDLTDASDDQIKAVTNLVWEIKGLFYKLISGKASDVLADLNLGSGGKLSPSLVADLTASLPRDVVISAHQEWLPNLGTEMADGQHTSEQDESGWSTAITESRLAGSVSPEELLGLGARQAAPKLGQPAAGSDVAGTAGAVRLAQANQQIQTKSAPGTVAKKSWQADPVGRVDKAPEAAVQAVQPQAAPAAVAAGKADTANAAPSGGTETPAASAPPQNQAAGQTDDLLYPDGGAPEAASGNVAQVAAQPEAPAARIATSNAQPEGAARTPATANVQPNGGTATLAAAPPPQNRAGGQTDDLLYPDGGAPEAAGSQAPSNDGAAGSAPPAADASADAPSDAASGDAAPAVGADSAAAEPQPRAAPVISIQSDVDPESWAEYGGWYRQDYAIFYRPTGHKDKFIYSWLVLTGLQAPKGDTSPAAAVFDSLTAKDAQGSCTKCHSVDDIRGKGRLVNFSPRKVESKQGRFTNFVHEPHFGVMKDRGCLTCHSLAKGSPYLKSYEQSSPQNFASNFGAVKKELCQTCHTSSMARQDCLLCHKYHLNDVITPIMNTRIPAQ